MIVSRCDACPFKELETVPCEQASSGPPRLAIVGEAPGWNEMNQGRPFVGASGKMLQRGLATLGITRDQVHWTNAILCNVGQDPAKQKIAAKACGPRLRAELAASGAPIIVPVGAWALGSVMALGKKPQILKWRGSVSRINLPRQPSSDPASASGSGGSSDPAAPVSILVAPTVHPAFVMRSPGYGPVLQKDFKRIGRLLEGGFQAPEESRVILVPKDLSSVEHAIRALENSQALSFDVETVGLGPHATPLVCFGISSGPVTAVFPWSRGRDGQQSFWTEPQEKIITSMISNLLLPRVMVTHNGPNFDHIVAYRYGLQFDKWEDTLLGTHVLRSHLPKNLAFTVTQYIDVPPWKQLEDRTATIERLWFYNARDALYTILAWQQMKKELDYERQAS